MSPMNEEEEQPQWAVAPWSEYLRLAAPSLSCEDDGGVLALVALVAAGDRGQQGNPYPVARWAREAGAQAVSEALRSLITWSQGLPAMDDEGEPLPVTDEEYIRWRVDQERDAAGLAAVFADAYNQGAMDDGIQPVSVDPPDPFEEPAVAAEAMLEIEEHRARCRRAAGMILRALEAQS